MNPTTGFTLIEVLVTIMLICVLIAITAVVVPRVDRAPDTSTLPARVASTLEAAHSQAVEEGVTVTIQANGDTLQLTSAGETTVDRFVQANFAGGFSIRPDGTSAGALDLTPPGQACTRFTLGIGGLAQQGAC